ncbi:MAG: hypothetical protein N2319_03065 [Candidatus Kapabacteria bacterium]|nr:hypothetical protein [Candidatus Kapabacteria bacterium]
MGKGGGAGKVYFVLYLAVVLELLIIIVERDEAEQSLIQKQRETMKIVESILSQLQSGAGTEGINTRPQDEITIPPSGVNIREVMGADIKSYRKYIVEVGVTDVTAEIKRREGESEKEYVERIEKYIQLSNVQELEYQIFYSSNQDPENAPLFPTDEEIRKAGIQFDKFQPGQKVSAPDGGEWEFLSLRKLILDKTETMRRIDLSNVTVESLEPVYPRESELVIGPSYAPANKEDSVFFYSKEESLKRVGLSGSALKKRAFVVNFQPPNRAGWYKLRFASRTNRILGVRADENPVNIREDTKVNIGTVTLTVKDLMKVRKELVSKLERYNLPPSEILSVEGNVEKFNEMLENSKKLAAQGDNPTEDISKIELYGYIATLLAPGMSSNFAQNRGSIEFNIRVITPKTQISKPEVFPPDASIATFDKLPAAFEFAIAPYQGAGSNQVEAVVKDESGSTVARANLRPLDEIVATAAKPTPGGKRTYRAIVDRELPEGKYTIVMTHRLGSMPAASAEVELDVFKTGLVPENEKLINFRLGNVGYGDYFLLVNLQPNSGGKIRSEQFRIYLLSDIESQREPVKGFSITRENALFMDCKAKTATFRATWVQPLTGAELDIFPAKTVDIRQKRPTISLTFQPDVKTITQVKKRYLIKGIYIEKPKDGREKDKETFADVNVYPSQNVKLDSKIEPYASVSSDPIIETDGDKYNIIFELTFNLPRGMEKIDGSASVTLKAEAINRCNGKTSSVAEENFSVPVSFEIEKGPQIRTPGGGGGQQPPRGGRR